MLFFQLSFEKNNLLCKKREKNNLSRGKIPAAPPPPRISNGPSLSDIRCEYHKSDTRGRLCMTLAGSNNGLYPIFDKNRLFYTAVGSKFGSKHHEEFDIICKLFLI